MCVMCKSCIASPNVCIPTSYLLTDQHQQGRTVERAKYMMDAMYGTDVLERLLTCHCLGVVYKAVRFGCWVSSGHIVHSRCSVPVCTNFLFTAVGMWEGCCITDILSLQIIGDQI